MDIKSAQQDVRTAYLRGSVAQAIMGMFWLSSAALGTWVRVYFAILMMVLAIALTFPLTPVTLHILGRPMGLPGSHPMNQLVFQIALIIPLSLLLIGPISLYNLNWFFPDAFPPGRWFTGIVLMLFALLVQRPLHFTQQ